MAIRTCMTFKIFLFKNKTSLFFFESVTIFYYYIISFILETVNWNLSTLKYYKYMTLK